MKKENKTYQTFTLDKKVLKDSRIICDEYGFSMSAVVNKLIEKWIEDVDSVFPIKRKEEGLDLGDMDDRYKIENLTKK